MGKFIPGQSGNPSGRPKGALNKITLASRALLEGEAEILTRKAIELAKAGNPVALRLCIQRLLPPLRRDRTINFTLPKMEGPQDLFKGIAAILEAVAQGEITPWEGSTLTTPDQAGIDGPDYRGINAMKSAKAEGQLGEPKTNPALPIWPPCLRDRPKIIWAGYHGPVPAGKSGWPSA